MNQHRTGPGHSNDLKPIELKNGQSSGANFFLYTFENQEFLRKSISGKTSKLKEQFNWLKSLENNIHIPKVFNPKEESNSFSYDLPYYSKAKNAHDLFAEGKLSSLSKVIEALDSLKSETSQVTAEQADTYVKEKLLGKVHSCLAVDPDLSSRYPDVSDILNLLRNKTDSLATGENYNIHGDATLENILIDENGKIILIDPNGENILSTHEVEFAKLFQSLNSHYEDLTSKKIDLSQALDRPEHALLVELKNIIKKRGGENSLRRVYFHEIIHLARLLPYKQKNQPELFELFFNLFINRSRQFLSE